MDCNFDFKENSLFHDRTSKLKRREPRVKTRQATYALRRKSNAIGREEKFRVSAKRAIYSVKSAV